MSKTSLYILDNQNIPVVETDVIRWARWLVLATADRVVAQTTCDENVEVSTVFLGLDHNFSGSGPPLLYETMVFGGPLDGATKRYATRVKAKTGHDRMVEQVQGHET